MSPIGLVRGGGAAPVDFKRIWYVNQAGGAGASFYAKINNAIDAILALPPAQRPSPTEPQLIIVHPGDYDEKVWLPDWVWMQAVAPGSVIISGGSDVILEDAVISIGIGGMANIAAIPSGTSGQAAAVLFSRNSTSLYTLEESDYGTIGNGDTLIVTPDGQSQETITFAGTETTAAQVAATINAQATNFSATTGFNRVGLTHDITPEGNGLTLHKEGTANAALGFYTDMDSISATSPFEIQIVQNSWFVNPGGTYGIVLTDVGGGSYYLVEPKTILCGTNGIYFAADAEAELRNPHSSGNSVGIYIEDDAKAIIDGGRSLTNTQDVVFGTGGTGELVAKAFAYAKRSGNGVLIPSGSRITFEWNLSGGISAGTLVDSARPIMYDCTIESVTLWRGMNGGSGSTIVDINEAASGGTYNTIYTTQANRPSVAFDTGSNVVVLATLPDVINLSKGHSLSMDIDQKEGGNPQDLNITITAVVN